jgi:hypothetical protein
MSKHIVAIRPAVSAWFAVAMATIQLNAQTPSFVKTQLDSKFRSEGVALGDFNRDGLVDIAAGNVWYQAPTWQMQTMRGAPIEFDPLNYSDSFSNFVDDLNRDGWDDLIVVGFPGTPTLWYENPKSTGLTWMPHQAVAVTNNESPWYVDMNGDGQRVLVFGYSPDGNPDSEQRRMAIAQPGQNPTQPWNVRTISGPGGAGSEKFSHGLGVGDMNLDGRKDVVTPKGWYESPLDPLEALWNFHPRPLGPDAGQMHVYDFDVDGDQDVLSSSSHNYGVWWHERTLTTFVTHEISSAFSQSHALQMADINRDGLPDFVTGKRYFAHAPPGDPGTFEPAVLYWFEYTRTGNTPSWIPHLIDSDSGMGTQFQIGDVNGDGRLDIVTANKKGVFLFQQISDGPDPVLGDYNQNGAVDASDYVVWRDTLSRSGTGLAADGNANGTIDPADYGIWRAQFGRRGGSLPTAFAIPEPSAAWLLVVAVSYFGVYRPRTRKRINSP